MKKKSFIKLTLVYFAIFLTVFSLTACSSYKNQLEVHVIDVGQGDSTLVVTPDQKNILIDAGEDEYARNVIRHLKKSNIKKLDAIIGTHFDSDHIGGIDKVIAAFPTSTVYFPPSKASKTDLLEIIDVCRKKNIKITPLKSGDQLKLDQTLINVLSPRTISTSDENKNSLIFTIYQDGTSFMFTGDADSELERNVICHYRLPQCIYLKVGHHGSKTASCDDFIKAIRPQIASISCGYKNKYGHPHQETLDTLKKYQVQTFRSDLNGDMVFYFDVRDTKKIYSKKKYVLE
nr:ComEC/Rec2 family competence protein [uncultured Peptostreptococcus sp.]